MKDRARMKWRMIKAVLKSDNCILIHQVEEGFDYKFAGCNLVYALLFQRLTQYIPKWYKRFVKCANSAADETD